MADNKNTWIFVLALFILWMWAKNKKSNRVTHICTPATNPCFQCIAITGGPTKAVVCKQCSCAYLYPTYTTAAPQGRSFGSVLSCASKIIGSVPIIGTIVRSAGSIATAVTCQQKKTLCVGPQSCALKTPCDVQAFNYETRLLGYCCNTLPLLPSPKASGTFVSKCGPPAFQYDGKIFYPGQNVKLATFLFPVSSCWLLGSYGYQPNPTGTPGGKCVPKVLTYPLGILGATENIPLDPAIAHAAALQAYGVSEDANPIPINGGF